MLKKSLLLLSLAVFSQTNCMEVSDKQNELSPLETLPAELLGKIFFPEIEIFNVKSLSAIKKGLVDNYLRNLSQTNKFFSSYSKDIIERLNDNFINKFLKSFKNLEAEDEKKKMIFSAALVHIIRFHKYPADTLIEKLISKGVCMNPDPSWEIFFKMGIKDAPGVKSHLAAAFKYQNFDAIKKLIANGAKLAKDDDIVGMFIDAILLNNCKHSVHIKNLNLLEMYLDLDTSKVECLAEILDIYVDVDDFEFSEDKTWNSQMSDMIKTTYKVAKKHNLIDLQKQLNATHIKLTLYK